MKRGPGEPKVAVEKFGRVSVISDILYSKTIYLIDNEMPSVMFAVCSLQKLEYRALVL